MKQQVVSQVINDSGIAFGTSGARGLVTDFSPEVCTAFTVAFIKVMQKQFDFTKLAMAIDNRPSSPDIAAACIAAAQALDIEVDYYGVIPTPALAVTSMSDNVPAIMVTGSHIPFDRNGLKFYRPDGEISKADEVAILTSESELIDFAIGSLPVVSERAANAYLARYLNLFSADSLKGKRIGIYEHSSAGRDLYAGLFEKLGAKVISLGRSDNFVPIDTEAVSQFDIDMAVAWQKEFKLDAVFSTDGDGDRPLLSDETGNYLRGDILCLLASKCLNVEVLAVPVSCNSVIEKCGVFTKVERTKIGSPYVISAFNELKKSSSSVAGFEANGGFLLGTDIIVNGGVLSSLPTRDALLPALAVLTSIDVGKLSDLVRDLPEIYTASDRIQNFSRENSLELIQFGLNNPKKLLIFLGLKDSEVINVDITDGLRLSLNNSEIVHLRPSGNAPELRCYAEACSAQRAKYIVAKSLKAIFNSSLNN
ncbi:phosphomannomutase [Shewanella sp. 10N.286.52.B9]|uniref:phosphomannomutase n=1 Tax=Shewanella sp. 10N.286.52.B9 TaxID=1880837 RepID=UPI000C84ABBA|nr:phosphomannomutase [Shewanella sp. 10N.286.52.B9]PMG42159.1 phosphomannomutase [Shewanella sp. 10N.286.52.B9]